MSAGHQFRLDLAQQFRDDVNLLMLRAIRKGVLPALIAALHELQSNLSTDPTSWGDPINNYPHLGLVGFRRL